MSLDYQSFSILPCKETNKMIHRVHSCAPTPTSETSCSSSTSLSDPGIMCFYLFPYLMLSCSQPTAACTVSYQLIMFASFFLNRERKQFRLPAQTQCSNISFPVWAWWDNAQTMAACAAKWISALWTATQTPLRIGTVHKQGKDVGTEYLVQ